MASSSLDTRMPVPLCLSFMRHRRIPDHDFRVSTALRLHYNTQRTSGASNLALSSVTRGVSEPDRRRQGDDTFIVFLIGCGSRFTASRAFAIDRRPVGGGSGG